MTCCTTPSAACLYALPRAKVLHPRCTRLHNAARAGPAAHLRRTPPGAHPACTAERRPLPPHSPQHVAPTVGGGGEAGQRWRGALTGPKVTVLASHGRCVPALALHPLWPFMLSLANSCWPGATRLMVMVHCTNTSACAVPTGSGGSAGGLGGSMHAPILPGAQNENFVPPPAHQARRRDSLTPAPPRTPPTPRTPRRYQHGCLPCPPPPPQPCGSARRGRRPYAAGSTPAGLRSWRTPPDGTAPQPPPHACPQTTQQTRLTRGAHTHAGKHRARCGAAAKQQSLSQPHAHAACYTRTCAHAPHVLSCGSACSPRQ